MSPMRYTQIGLKHRPGWTQLTIQAETRIPNGFNPVVCSELSSAIKACEQDLDTSVILISSSGPVFCSGIDIFYLLEGN